jgi:hypothetical protein
MIRANRNAENSEDALSAKRAFYLLSERLLHGSKKARRRRNLARRINEGVVQPGPQLQHLTAELLATGVEHNEPSGLSGLATLEQPLADNADPAGTAPMASARSEVEVDESIPVFSIWRATREDA